MNDFVIGVYHVVFIFLSAGLLGCALCLLLCLGHENSIDMRALLRRYPETDQPLLDALQAALVDLLGTSGTPEAQRFLLGLASPAAMRARLWSHPLYGALADRKWEDVWIEAHALSGS